MTRARSVASIGCAVAAVAYCPAASAAIVWGGPPITFIKPNGANYNLPQYQDHITDNVWITRAAAGGIFNIAVESSYNDSSPADTEWAYGTATNWQNLTFAPWVEWNGHFPPGMVNDDAVVHLISDDIYINIKFLSWSCCGAGGFSYMRSTLPAPSALAVLALGSLLPARARRRRAP